MLNYIKKFVDSDSTSPEAHTYFAEFLFKEFENVFSAHYHLNLAKNGVLHMGMKFKQFYLKKTIKNEVNPNEVGNKK